jgi:2-iminobutanoate/2-iminopropanoate deaminase
MEIMAKQVFHTDKAPKPKGPYSLAVIHNGILYISGQMPIDAASGSVIRGTIEEETRLTLSNIKTIVEEYGCQMADVIKVTCYLLDMSDFDAFNRIYAEYFPDSPPARTTIQVAGLPAGVKIEIDAIVSIPR